MGGVSVAFVILMLLPALSRYQMAFQKAVKGGVLGNIRDHIYIIVLVSLVLYYGLERIAESSRATAFGDGNVGKSYSGIFWLHMVFFSFLNLLVGYSILNQAKNGLASLFFYSLAMLFFFIVNDRGLYAKFESLYTQTGRWILAVATLARWTVNRSLEISTVGPAVLQAFIAGATILNVLKEELPEERESRYWAFALGAFAYAILLLAF
jgi:hypothetical protein